MKPPMFHVSGFLDGRTWSVAREIFAKSVIKTSRSIAKAETTNLPVTRSDCHESSFQYCPADLVDDPCQNALVNSPSLSTSATMFVNPGSVRTTLAAPLATSVALLTAYTDFSLAQRKAHR